MRNQCAINAQFWQNNGHISSDGRRPICMIVLAFSGNSRKQLIFAQILVENLLHFFLFLLIYTELKFSYNR